MTPEEQDELLKLLEGSAPGASGPLEPLPDAAWAGSPIARMPFESSGLPDPSTGGAPVDMSARRDADIDAFLSGAPIPQAPAASPMPARPEPRALPSLGEPPTSAPPYRFTDRPDPFGVIATLPGMQRPAERTLQNASRDKALLDFWAREREPQDRFLGGTQRDRLQWNREHPTATGRPLLPEEAPEPRTFAEAQALHGMYRGNLDPERVAKLPGAPKPPPLPRTYAEASVMPPEQREDVLRRFAELKQKYPQGDEVWSQFLGTLPGAPKPVAGPSDLDAARAEAARAQAEMYRARAGKYGATGGGNGGGAGVSVTGKDTPDDWIAIVQKYAERGDIGDPSAYIARLQQAGAVHGKERGRVMQQVMKDVDTERRSRSAPALTLQAHKLEGLDQEEAALLELVPVLEKRAREQGDSRLPSAGNVFQRGAVATEKWLSGGSGMDDVDTWMNTRLNVAGQGAYKAQTGQVANQGQEQELSRQLYLGTGKYSDMLQNVRKRLQQIQVLRGQGGSGERPGAAPAPRPQPRQKPAAQPAPATAPDTYTVTMPDGTVLNDQPLTMQQAIAARKRGAQVVPN